MKIIVGLGNPGKQYELTRHNAGFLVLDFILYTDGFMEAKPSHDFKSETFTWQKDSQKIIFLKPQTYMNDSGQALKIICNFYKLNLVADLLVIHDDVDLPFGQFRLTDGSSSAGHNGIKSIIQEIGSQDFHRIRIGIESRESRQELPTDAFVLQNFTADQLQALRQNIFPQVLENVKQFVAN